MERTRLVGFVLACAAFLGAACAERVVSVSAEEAAFDPPGATYPFSKMQAGKAMVVIMRPNPRGEAVKFTVVANGVELGSLGTNGYRAYEAVPGPNVFRISIPEGAMKEIPLNVEASKAYFINAWRTKEGDVLGVDAALVAPGDGLKKFNQCLEVIPAPRAP